MVSNKVPGRNTQHKLPGEKDDSIKDGGRPKGSLQISNTTMMIGGANAQNLHQNNSRAANLGIQGTGNQLAVGNKSRDLKQM